MFWQGRSMRLFKKFNEDGAKADEVNLKEGSNVTFKETS